MGIKIRNLDEYTLALKMGGTITTTGIDQSVSEPAPFAGFITNIYATVAKAKNGVTTMVLDLTKNGTTVFSSTVTQLNFVGTTGLCTYGALTTDPIAVAAGDFFALDVDAIGVQHNGVSVLLTISRRNPAVSTTLADLSTL